MPIELDLKEVWELNEKYMINNANGDNKTKENFKIIKGDIPILLSAPHAVKQLRNGKIKSQDAMTGGIVEYLAKKCNCWGITRIYNNNDDPNADVDGIGMEYKRQIIELVKQKEIMFMIDVHGCTDRYGFDFDIGTNKKINIKFKSDYLEYLKLGLECIGKVNIGAPFDASCEGNVSKTIASATDCCCVQLEISSKNRLLEENLYRTLQTLETTIQQINTRLLQPNIELSKKSSINIEEQFCEK